MTDPAIPACPGCLYDLTGLPDGRCPECGRRFTCAELRSAEHTSDATRLADALAAAVLRIMGWSAVLAVPLWLIIAGARIVIISGLELWDGSHWTDTNYRTAWTPQTTLFPTAREAFWAGLLWIVAGVALGLTVAAVVRGVAWVFVGPDAAPYTEPPSESPRPGASRP